MESTCCQLRTAWCAAWRTGTALPTSPGTRRTGTCWLRPSSFSSYKSDRQPQVLVLYRLIWHQADRNLLVAPRILQHPTSQTGSHRYWYCTAWPTHLAPGGPDLSVVDPEGFIPYADTTFRYTSESNPKLGQVKTLDHRAAARLTTKNVRYQFVLYMYCTVTALGLATIPIFLTLNTFLVLK